MNVAIDIPGADPQGRVFLTWAPVKATARLTDGPGAGTNVNVTLRSAGPVGGLLFDTVRSQQGTGSLTLSLAGDGTPTPFWVAGEFGKPSADYGDAAIEASAEDGSVLGSTPVMVRIRKNANTLATGERDRFLAALGTLNGRGQGAYKDFRDMHVAQTTREMHGNVGFPPWHRAYVLDLERTLQAIDPTVAIPYWRFDQAAPNVFTAAFMGQARRTGTVTFTPGHALEHWFTDGQPGIVRSPRFKLNQPALVRDEAATMALGQSWDPFQTDEDDGFEIDPHGSAHTSFNGPISRIPTAVRDPLFFMLHANVDRLWAKWQWLNHLADPQNPDAYAPPLPDPQFPGAHEIGHHLGDTMWPWNGVTGSPRPATAPGGPFPSSPATPAPGSTPMVQDVFDHLGVTGGDHLAFAYDDVPFELPATVVAGGPASPSAGSG
jgi:tyrosinase